MLSKDNIINLEDFRVKAVGKNVISKVFTGRDRGLAVRDSSNIDAIADNFDEVQIIIPKDIYSINPSFFEELFVNVVIKFGRDDFFKKFKIISEGSYNYEKPLTEAIDRILRTNTALG